MAWQKIDVDDLSSSAGSVTTTADPPKIFNLCLTNVEKSSVAADGFVRLGSTTVDTGSNYSWRKSLNGAADTTGVNATSILLIGMLWQRGISSEVFFPPWLVPRGRSLMRPPSGCS